MYELRTEPNPVKNFPQFAKMERIQEENSPMVSSRSFGGCGDGNGYGGGWYNSRRQYRSVAFGTWKVGGARDFSIKRGISENGSQLSRSLDTNRNYIVSTANCFCTLHSTKSTKFRLPTNCNHIGANISASMKQESTITAMDKQRMEQTPGPRSVNISELDRINGNVASSVVSLNDKKLVRRTDTQSSLSAREEQFTGRYYGSLSRRKKDKLETSIQRAHQRSRSAGNDNLFSLRLSPYKQSFSNMSTRSSHPGNGGTLLNPLKATKKFFKKIYDSATLPSRSHSKASTSTAIVQTEIPISSSSPQYPFFEICYSSELPDEERNYQYDQNVVSSQCPTNSSTMADHDSTASTAIKPTTAIIDDQMNDSGLSKSVSSNDSQKTSSSDFRSWDEVFDHLKREMAYMRQRDAQIFADLQFVELQLRNVKNRAIAASKSDYTIRNNGINMNSHNEGVLERRQVKLGELVESMPL